MTDEPEPNFQPCCAAWAEAHEWETDNEGYSPLISTVEPINGNPPQVSRTGYSDTLPDILFCPWCGARKQSRHTLAELLD